MNKYLEKIANRAEMEPGVHYDLASHSLKVTPGAMREHLDREDTKRRLIFSVPPAGILGVVGASVVDDALRRNHIDAHPQTFYKLDWYENGWVKTLGKNLRTPIPPRHSGNFFSRLGDKHGIGKVSKIGSGLGALGGAALGGSIGYFLNGIPAEEKSTYKDEYLSKLERKYENRIDELEGWK
jgi:hypothetical protein